MKQRKRVRTVCPFCAVGCHVDIVVEGERAVALDYAEDSPVNGGILCAKGNAVLEILDHPKRLLHPCLRVHDRWEESSWRDILDWIAERVRRIHRHHGPDALGFLASAKCTNEENYLIQKLARHLGTHNVDHCARLCHSSTLAGLIPSLGAGAATNPLSDLVHSRSILIVGSNPAENHPVAFRWIREAKDKGALVITADPRFTSTAWIADLHLPIRPGSDIALVNAMLHVIFREGIEDAAFLEARTRGVEMLRKSVSEMNPSRAEVLTGVPASDIVKAARIYASNRPSSLLYCMGITQHKQGTQAVQACANLVLATGNMGRQGSGLLPIRGQDNVQGACDMGALSGFLPGYRPVTDPSARSFFEECWNLEKETLPPRNGLTVTEMEEEAGRSLRALVVMGENPVLSSPGNRRVRNALKRLDLLVVMDIFPTETAELAHAILPACAWAEKSGSKTSTDRRVQWSPRATAPPGHARPDWWILTQLGRRLTSASAFPYEGPEEILEEIAKLVPTYAGITAPRLKKTPGGLFWPCPSEDHPGTPILHRRRFPTPRGQAQLHPVSLKELPEEPGREFPFLLTTGRVTLHYNSGSLTRRIESLQRRFPCLHVEVNQGDAREQGIQDGRKVRLTTPRGSVDAVARVSSTVPRGVLFLPFHFPGVNEITQACLDPVSKIPEFKTAACRIEILGG